MNTLATSTATCSVDIASMQQLCQNTAMTNNLLYFAIVVTGVILMLVLLWKIIKIFI